jgi:DNA-binding FrmR family transcriptional regulator
MELSSEAREEIFARLRRIEGQARGIQRMVTEERGCLEILTQLASLRSAAYSASVSITQHYAAQCVRDASGVEVPAEEMRGLVDVLLRAPH